MTILIPTLISAGVGITSALLTTFLSQHYFWRRQREFERRVALLDELNRVASQLLNHGRMDYETAAAERRAPRLDPQDPVLLALSTLHAQVKALFRQETVNAVEALVDQLIALGDSVPEKPWSQAADGVVQARVKALRALYKEIGMPIPKDQ